MSSLISPLKISRVNRIRKELTLPVVLILLLSFFVNVYGIWWGLPSFVGWAPDDVLPSSVFKAVSQGFSNGWYHLYPPVYFYVLAILYSPFLILGNLGLVDINSLQTYTTLFYLGRFLSVFLGTAIVFLVYLCGREIYDKQSSLFAALITALMCPFVYYAKVTNVDALCIFWLMLSLIFYVMLLKSQRIRDYVLFSITAVTAICTKDSAYGFYVLTSLFIIYRHYVYQKQQESSVTIVECLAKRKIILPLLLGIVLFATYHNLLFNWSGFLGHIKFLMDTGVLSPQGKFKQVINIYVAAKSIAFSLGLPIFLICSVAVFRAVLQKQKNHLLLALLVPAVSFLIFTIIPGRFLFDRYLFPISIIFALFGGKLLSDILSSHPSRFRYNAKVFFVSLIFLYTFAYSFSTNILMAEDSRYVVEDWMRKNINSKSSVLAIGRLPYFLPRFDSQNFKSVISAYPSLSDIKRGDSDYVVTTQYDYAELKIRKQENSPQNTNSPEQLRDDEVYEVFSGLDQEKFGYQLALKYRSNPKWNLLTQWNWLTCDDSAYSTRSKARFLSMFFNSNLCQINPEIKIFKKK